MPQPGTQGYVAFVGEIIRVVVIEEGAGNYKFKRGEKPKRACVVRTVRSARCGLEAGDEFCVSADDVYTNPVDANKASARMSREVGGGYEEDDDLDPDSDDDLDPEDEMEDEDLDEDED